jgi:C4-dicarboxylate-specific signal transduction histidine kinase
VDKEELAVARALREQRRIDDKPVGVLRPNGSRVWLETTAAPIPARGYGVVASFTDVTERKEAIEKEKRHQVEIARFGRLSLLGEMASTLAHELGQPLNSTLSYIEGAILRLKAGDTSPEKIEAALNAAKRHVEQAGGIVTRVRNYARRHRPMRVAADLNDLFRDVASFLSYDFQSHGTLLRLDLAPEIPAISADRVEIEQVILNLLRNALEATEEVAAERRVVEVSTCRRSRNAVEAVVRDFGSGLSRAAAPRIFEPYFTTKESGLGLGLSICRRIVASHHGTLTARSARPHGSRFILRLPIDERR